MGKLLSLLARDDSNCCTPQKYEIFLDFENADPSDKERPVYEEVAAVLESSEGILNELSLYKGAGREIREAITTPTDIAQARAWHIVLPLVEKLKRFYYFSLELERVIPKLLRELCSGSMSPSQHLETQQALVKQFAHVLEFVLKFDECKMKTPAIQNDFSFYRRSLNRRRPWLQDTATAPGDEMSPDLANNISLFYAHATPMLRAITQATSNFLQENKDIPIENTTETLATMAKVCLRMLESPSLVAQFEKEETELLVLRVMVGLVILYDHVHPSGAFTKPSSLDVKGCVRLLKDQPPVKSESLLNALRYTTKHLNEEATPKQIKNLLAT
uniref:Protein FAM49A n=1 Tax=Lygus hesperus TaxID=30085 RepID=A0A0A9YMC2_LYGHE